MNLLDDKHAKNNPFTCEACDMVFCNPSELAQHLITGFPLDDFTKDFLLSNLNLNSFPLVVGVPPCRSGPVNHSDKLTKTCTVCFKVFKNSRGLNQHIGKIHNNR